MKTSATQFEAIVDFMERHGDLVKPGDGPAGRLRAIQLWKELAERLNLDVTGDTKTVDKWKKVWSDFKLNTKRKAAKIHRAALRTGGGPPCRLYLSDLEQRVLTIIGPQSATGLVDVPEVGVEISQPPPVLTCSTDEITPTLSFSDIQIILPESDPRMSPLRRSRSASRSPLRRPGSPVGRPGTFLPRPRPALRSPLRHRRSPVQRIRSASRSPLRRSRSVSPLRRPESPLRRERRASLSPLQRTSPQRTVPRRNTSSRTNPRPTTARSQLDDVSARFMAQDQHWRDFFQVYAREQARLRERELEQQAVWQNLAQEYIREQVRLRERELEQQAVWQNLARDGVDLLKQLFLNK